MENSSSQTATFRAYVKKHSSEQLLNILAACQLMPINHGKFWLFEPILSLILTEMDVEEAVAIVNWEELREALESFKTEDAPKDTPLHAFTGKVNFFKGEHIICCGDKLVDFLRLNEILEMVFLTSNDLDEDFKHHLRAAAEIMLLIGAYATTWAKLGPHLFDEDCKTTKIECISTSAVDDWVDALIIDKAVFASTCKRLELNDEVAAEFFVEKGKELATHIGKGGRPRPLIDYGDKILLFMPTQIVPALLGYIDELSVKLNCQDLLSHSLTEHQAYKAGTCFERMSWNFTNIQIPTQNLPILPVETVWRFDNLKLAFVSYISRAFFDSLSEKNNLLSERFDQFIAHITNLETEFDHHYFGVVVLADDIEKGWYMDLSFHADRCFLILHKWELEVISNSEKVDFLTLWKFTQAAQAAGSQFMIVVESGLVLDLFFFYRSMQDSLRHSDHSLAGGLFIHSGICGTSVRQLAIDLDLGSALRCNPDGCGYTAVAKHRAYAPIYRSTHSPYLALVILMFKPTIWVSSSQTKSGQGWGAFIADAVTFWLCRLKDYIQEFINSLAVPSVEIDVHIEDSLLNEDPYPRKEFNTEDIRINSSSTDARIQLRINQDFVHAVQRADNFADKLLMKAVLEEFVTYAARRTGERALTSKKIHQIIEECLQPDRAKMLLSLDVSRNPRLDNRNLVPVRYIQNYDISSELQNIVSYLPDDYVVEEHIAGRDNKLKLCDDVVRALIRQIELLLANLDKKFLISRLVRLNESCVFHREYQEIQVPARIACFSSEHDEVKKLLDTENSLASASHAVRTLIEFCVTDGPVGTRPADIGDIDRLMALTDLLTNWGELSQTIRFGLADPEIGLLPSGRIGVGKDWHQQRLDPFTSAKAEADIFTYSEDFISTYSGRDSPQDSEDSQLYKDLDAAFLEEYGLTFSDLVHVVQELAHEELATGSKYTSVPDQEMHLKLEKAGLALERIPSFLSLLTMISRSRIGVPPENFSPQDIFPWRFNRNLSYLRRPFIPVYVDGSLNYCYGFRHLLAYLEHLTYLLFTAKLPDARTRKMKSWLSLASSAKGKPFRNLVKKWFEENTTFETIPYEVKMQPHAPRGHINADSNYGDIDLMSVDHDRKIIFAIECKNIMGGKNVHEMKNEIDEYLGRDGRIENSKIYKHVKRDAWLRSNIGALSKLVDSPASYEIKSIILTANETPLAYTQQLKLPLPIKSFIKLRKHGQDYLNS